MFDDSFQTATAKPLLFIVGGANGSGKTTLARTVAELTKLTFVNADETARVINPEDVHAARFQAGREVLKELETASRATHFVRVRIHACGFVAYTGAEGIQKCWVRNFARVCVFGFRRCLYRAHQISRSSRWAFCPR